MSELTQPDPQRSPPDGGSSGWRVPSVRQSLLRVQTLLADHPDGARASEVARSVFDVLTLLAERPDGVAAEEVAESVRKSTSTAYYLLASLSEEGFVVRCRGGGCYRLRHEGAGTAPRAGDPGADDLEATVDALFLRTRKDCYLGRVQADTIDIIAARGREGRPKIPGLGSQITEGLHALAMGKVLLALMPYAARRRHAYAPSGLRPYTSRTITSPPALMHELEQVRRTGVAIEHGEFHPDFCCVAAPMRDAHGDLVASIGLAAATAGFDAECDALVEMVLDAAAMSEPLQKIHAILRREGLAGRKPPDERCGGESQRTGCGGESPRTGGRHDAGARPCLPPARA